MKYLYLVTIKNNSYKYTCRNDILIELRKLKQKIQGATWHKYFFELDSDPWSPDNCYLRT